MKTAVLISRYLLGLMFTVFGLNGFLHFIPQPPPSGLAAQFLGAMAQSNYFVVIFLLQLAGGILLLTNRFVPLALVLLGPIVVNVLLYHLFMAPAGLPIALVTVILWFLVFSGVRNAFAKIFEARAEG